VERTDLKPRTLRARDLRSRSTDAEWKIWSILRNRQLGGFKFRRQVPIDRYFADFACLDAGLVVEIDGSQHTDPRTMTRSERACLKASVGESSGSATSMRLTTRPAWATRS